jgi:asparagine synthase (glutamine-hydrolysing)
MCGFAGFAGLPVRPDDASRLLRRMAGSLVHRGPDDEGVWFEAAAGVGFAHRRLAIQDLSPMGAQPMASASGRFVIAFNGEVYNFPELRRELTARGHAFRGGSDTEVMLAAFEEWGVAAAVPRFYGMFAFGVWDTRDRVLWLVRDRLGVKPLYVGRVGGAIVFGSELKALRLVPGFDRTVDRDALALFMRHDYIPGPYSIYRDVRKLEPGTMVRYNLGAAGQGGQPPRAEPLVYWSVEQAATNPVAVPADPAEAVLKLEEILHESIRIRLIADVPLGVLLSGGIDSSAVAALARHVMPGKLRTFSIGFREGEFDESGYARDVARALGTEHSELYVSAQDALEVVPQLARIYDEPFGDSSQIPTTLVSRLARKHVTVALSGDAGDELFHGYGRYATSAAIWARLRPAPAALRRLSAGLLEALPPALIDIILTRVSGRFGMYGGRGSPSQRLRRLTRLAREADWPAFYRGVVSRWTEFDDVVRVRERATNLLISPPAWMLSREPAEYMMLADIQTYLVEDILAKVDRASMSASLELREPLLDHRVVEYAIAAPLALKFRNNQTKWLLRQVAYRHVPEALLNRPKQGFEMPVGQWLRGPLRDWAESLLDPARLDADGYLDPVPVGERWREHQSGRLNWHGQLWNVLMFQAWLEEERRELSGARSAELAAA